MDASDRIVGGSEATEGSVPYMAALRVGFLTKWLICGGSIITNRHVLTAAHCIDAVHSDRTFRLVNFSFTIHLKSMCLSVL